jgi:phosphatidylglycerophosphate synthase
MADNPDLVQFVDSRTSVSEPPILILVSGPLTSPNGAKVVLARDGDQMSLGLSLTRRTVLAARRAGYGRVFLLAGGRPTSGAAAVSGWGPLAATFTSARTAPLFIAPSAILAETDWLKRLAEMRVETAAWAMIPDRIVMLTGGLALEALEALDEEGGALDLAAVERRLVGRFGPPAPIPSGIHPMVVETSQDLRIAERRLLRTLVKDTDGFMARHVERPVSLQISRRLAKTAITPNQMTMISIVVGLCAAPFFLSPRPSLQTIGALMFLAHSILDGCDGELARMKFQESRWGGLLDFWGDNVVHIVIFACMALGWSRSAAAVWPLLLGAAAVLGTLGAAGFVYWRTMRLNFGAGALFRSVSAAPERPLARLLDAASRRDFVYLVIILALIGRSNWFLFLAAVGAPTYFFMVIFLAARERLPNAPKPSGA